MITEKELLKGLTLEKCCIELFAREAQIHESGQFNIEDKGYLPIITEIINRQKLAYDEAPDPDEALKNISSGKLFQERIERWNWKSGRMDILKLFRESEPFERSHGEDGRLDGFELDNLLKRSDHLEMPVSLRTFIERGRENSKCTALVLREQDMDKNGEYFKLKIEDFKNAFPFLHSKEPFRDQTVVDGYAFTGFLVDENVIATVRHGLNGMDVRSLRFVFGYEMKDSETSNIKIPKENVYNGKSIIDCGPEGGDSDWALVEIDPPASGRKIAKLSKDKVLYKQGVYVWGFPILLPLKFAGGAYVCNDSSDIYFLTNLDIYSGNSGSPVFSSDTHEVVGIAKKLTPTPSGSRKYLSDMKLIEGSYITRHIPMDCSLGGSQCTRVTEFIDVLEKYKRGEPIKKNCDL